MDLEKLLARASRRRKVTDTLLRELNELSVFAVRLCDEMHSYPEINGLKVVKRYSNIGSISYLTVVPEEGGTWDILPERTQDIGRSFFLHGDFNAKMRNMNRTGILDFAKRVEGYFEGLSEYIARKIKEDTETIDRLKKLTKAIKDA